MYGTLYSRRLKMKTKVKMIVKGRTCSGHDVKEFEFDKLKEALDHMRKWYPSDRLTLTQDGVVTHIKNHFSTSVSKVKK